MTRARAVIALLACVAASCGGPTIASPAASQATIAPATGTLHLTTAQDYDTHDSLQLRYLDVAGLVIGEADFVDAETTISVDRTLPVGPIRVAANGKACDGLVPIELDVEVDVILAVADAGCTISIARSHARGAVAHPEPRTALGALVVLDSVLVVRPLDPANAIEPIRKSADMNAVVVDFAVPPGRYELAVLVNGAVQNTMDINLKRGQEFYYNLRVVAATVPRLCGQIPREQCEAAVTEAYARGLNPPPASANLVSVVVRPSKYSGCFDPPVFDVLFDVRGEPTPSEVTVATTARGLAVCSY